jgi:hypothetical protein
MRNKGMTSALLIAGMLSGCAVTPSSFYQNPSGHGDAKICRAYQGKEAGSDSRFRSALSSELSRRGKSVSDCPSIIADADRTNAAIGAALVGAAVLYQASKSGGGGGGSAAATTGDYSYAWDQFYHSSGSLVWACRGRQTGRFAQASNCAYEPRHDQTWPTK